MKKWLMIIVLITGHVGLGQNYVNYSEKDGLPSNHVYKITQDVHGFIWIATDEGLVKFNGSEFKTFTTKNGLPTNDIWNIFPANNGKIWYAAKNKSLGYILNDKVYNFPTSDGSTINPIYVGFDGNEMLAVGSHRNYRLKDGQWDKTIFEKQTQQYSLLLGDKFDYLDGDNTLLNLYKNEQITSIELLKDFKTSYARGHIYTRGQVTDSLYFWINEYSYKFLNLNQVKLIEYSFENELKIKNMDYSRIHLVNNELQITGSNNLGVLGKQLNVVKKIAIPKRFNSHFSMLDREGNIWVATFSKGLYFLSADENEIRIELPNQKINKIKSVNNIPSAVIKDKGFYSYNFIEESFELDYEAPVFLYDIAYIKELETTFYMTNYEVIAKNSQKKNVFTFPYRNELARSLTYHKNYLYSHNVGGIRKLDPTTFKVVKDYNMLGVKCISSFNNRLIIGTSIGLRELLKDELVTINSNLDNFQGPISSITQLPNDNLLLTTSGYGVYITDLEKVTLLEGSDLLSCNTPCIDNGDLYVPTNEGIYYYHFKDDTYTLKKIWNRSNGLPTNKINGVKKVDNKLLIATNQGIVHFPLDYEPSTRLIDLYLENSSFQDSILTANTSVPYQYINTVNFTIKSIDYRPRQELDYEFKLSPIQKDWTATSSGNLTFGDLQPNQYTLQIRNGELLREFKFSITPQWYQSWIFYLAALLLLIFLIIYITKYLIRASETKRNEELRQSKQLSELQLKALRSQMNPHFVFNSLTAIQYYINENDFETSDTYLVKFSRLIREFFELSKEQIVTIDREIKLLSNYLALEQLRFKGKLNYVFEIDPHLNITDQLPSMLLQPLVENAVNHGIFNKETIGNILIKFTRITVNELKICIEDDGVGYDKKKEDERFKSTTILEDRLKYLRGAGAWEITVERSDVFPNQNDKGHKVSLHLKKIEL